MESKGKSISHITATRKFLSDITRTLKMILKVVFVMAESLTQCIKYSNQEKTIATMVIHVTIVPTVVLYYH